MSQKDGVIKEDSYGLHTYVPAHTHVHTLNTHSLAAMYFGRVMSFQLFRSLSQTHTKFKAFLSPREFKGNFMRS